jgi:hypothetical protein
METKTDDTFVVLPLVVELGTYKKGGIRRLRHRMILVGSKMMEQGPHDLMTTDHLSRLTTRRGHRVHDPHNVGRQLLIGSLLRLRATPGVWHQTAHRLEKFSPESRYPHVDTMDIQDRSCVRACQNTGACTSFSFPLEDKDYVS